MVNEKVVLDTIKKMKQSGLDDQIIKNTLLDIGLGEQEASSFLEQVSGKLVKKTESVSVDGENVSTVGLSNGGVGSGQENEDLSFEDDVQDDEIVTDEHEQIAEKTAQKVKQHIDSQAQELEFHQTRTNVSLDEHKNTLDEIHSKVDSMHSDFSSNESVKTIKVIEKEIQMLKKDLSETKALQMATKELMEKILEANRKLLNKLD